MRRGAIGPDGWVQPRLGFYDSYFKSKLLFYLISLKKNRRKERRLARDWKYEAGNTH